MISCRPISDLAYVRCHTGAYYRSGWDLQILVELHAYPHLRDVRRDDDLFTIFMMIPQWSLSGVAQLGLHFLTLRCHHAFLLGDAPLIYGYDSVIDMDDLDRAFDDGWFELIWFSDLSHFDATLGRIPYFGQMCRIPHWFARSSSVLRYTSGWWFYFIVSWYSVEPFLSLSARFTFSDIVVFLNGVISGV